MADKNSTSVTPFVFPGDGKAIRSLILPNGEPGFVGKDVAERLGYADTVNAIKQHCKGVAIYHPLPTAGGLQDVRILTEPDVLRLIVSSNLPAAQEFERWVFEEVLPSIRRTERDDLRADWEAAERRAIEFCDILGRYTLVMQAFMIDAMREAGAPGEMNDVPASVYWINNTLVGPGHMVPDEALQADGQTWFDAKMAEHDAFRAAHPAPGQPVVGELRRQVRVLQAQLASVPLAGTKAAIDVSAERRRQVDAEGYDHQHDDAHVGSEIAAAACFYAMPPGAREWDTSSTGYGGTLGDAIVPDGWVLSAGSRRRDLVKAGALILAEIERMDRAAAIKAGRDVPGARLAVGERLHIG